MLLTLLLTPHSFFYSLLSRLLSEIKISDIGKPTSGESTVPVLLFCMCYGKLCVSLFDGSVASEACVIRNDWGQ